MERYYLRAVHLRKTTMFKTSYRTGKLLMKDVLENHLVLGTMYNFSGPNNSFWIDG